MKSIMSIATQAASKRVEWETLPSPKAPGVMESSATSYDASANRRSRIRSKLLADFGLHLGVLLLLSLILGLLATLGTPVVPPFTLLKVDVGEGDCKARLEIGLWGLCVQGSETGDCYISRPFGSAFASIQSDLFPQSTRAIFENLSRANSQLFVAAQVAPIIFCITTFLTVNLFFCAAKAYRFKGTENRWVHTLGATGALYSFIWAFVSYALMIALSKDLRRAVEEASPENEPKTYLGAAPFMMLGAANLSAWALALFVYWRSAEKYGKVDDVSRGEADNHSAAAHSGALAGKAKAEEAAAGKQLLERQNSYASVSTLPVYEIPRDGTAQP